MRIALRAKLEIDRAKRWWAANHPAAPGAVTAEIRSAIKLIRAQPGLAPHARDTDLPGIRRLLLPRTRYHLYYLYDPEEDAVDILALWHSARGSSPTL